MWSFRRVNSPYEVKNVPPFSKANHFYMPTRKVFLAQWIAISAACYLTLDLLALRPPPQDPAKIFDPAVIPIFSRLGDVTLTELKTKFS